VRVSRLMTGLAVMASLSVAMAAPVRAAGPQTVLDLEMDEAPGATVAVDSSGLGHDGAIGSHLVAHNGYITWDRHSPDEHIYYGAAHLIMVPDAADGSLDPGAGNFSVEIRYRSTVKFGNIIQKGQNKDAGGQVKFQQPGGIVGCMFKSPTGQAATNSITPLNDGQWHVVKCTRTPTEVDMYVDGVFRSRIRHTTGTINNKKPWTIGGKFDCDTSDPTVGADSCDYWAGDMDYVRITKG
jgi:hypothetical protein